MKKIWLFGLLFLSFHFTSCFELLEQISMNADGSGEMTVTLNLSESKEQLQTFLSSGGEELTGVSAPKQKDVDEFFKKVVAKVSAVEGISNVKSDVYYEDFIFSVSASFENVAAMNKAVNKFTKGMSRGMVKLKNDYTYNNGIFKRTFESPITEEEYENLPVMQRVVLESARIVSVYRFEKAIKDMSNKATDMSHDYKETRFESTLSDIITGVKTPSNEISF